MKVLIVDDSKTDVLMIQSILSDHETLTAEDGIEALEVLKANSDIDIMILDLNMPRMNGFEVLTVMSEHPDYKNIVTLILTNYDEVENEIKGLELGARDYLRKPLNIQALRIRIDLHTRLKTTSHALEAYMENLEHTIMERTRECNASRDVTINALVGLLEVRNIESANHTKRTMRMMKALCDHLREKEPYKSILSDQYINDLVSTSPLHDIGKVGVPDSILLKPGRLTEEEFEQMKKHTIYGVEALKCGGIYSEELSFVKTAIETVGTHHERYDGTGYPYGLTGLEIPLAGRLMAVIDVYDALSNRRVYKEAYGHEESLHIIKEGSGTQFDPDIVQAFFGIEKSIQTINSLDFSARSGGC